MKHCDGINKVGDHIRRVNNINPDHRNSDRRKCPKTGYLPTVSPLIRDVTQARV